MAHSAEQQTVWHVKPLKPKKCKATDCGKLFAPKSSLQRVCSPRCALSFAIADRKRKEDREHRKQKESIKPRSKWLQEAQSVFNKYIRLRDANIPCISCGRHHSGQYHAGHYRSVGAAPELRFCELNVHKQCAPCNNHKSGNSIDYRINLINKIGTERVEWLEGHHEPAKYSIDEIKLIKSQYQAKCRELSK